MELPQHSKNMYAPRELNYTPTVRANNDFRRVTARSQTLTSQKKKKTASGESKIPTFRRALHLQSVESDENSPVNASEISVTPGSDLNTPVGTPNKRRPTRWPGMFQTGTPGATRDKSIPPYNSAFENPRKPVIFDQPAGLESLLANNSAADFRHMVCNPKSSTPKPWRDGLERIFDSIALDSSQQEYIKFYTLGYNEETWPAAASVSLMEQAFLFGAMEKQWDLEVENGLYRFYNGIDDDGKLKGVPHYYYGDLD